MLRINTLLKLLEYTSNFFNDIPDDHNGKILYLEEIKMWFRDKYEIEILTFRSDEGYMALDGGSKFTKYYSSVHSPQLEREAKRRCTSRFDTYELALIEGLFEACDYLIKSKIKHIITEI